MEDDARPHGQEEILIEPQRIPDKIKALIYDPTLNSRS